MMTVFVLRDDGGEFAQGLGHEPRLLADVLRAHVALDLVFGRERGDGVDDDDVDLAGSHERFDDFERLLAGVGLRDEEVVDLHAELFGIFRIDRVLRVDECADAAFLLRFGDDVERERCFAGDFPGRISR